MTATGDLPDRDSDRPAPRDEIPNPETGVGIGARSERDTFEPEVAAVLDRLQNQATGAIAALMASEPALQDASGDDADLALSIEAMAQQLSGGVQSLAIWWQAHPDIEREWLVDRVMDYAWVGLKRIRSAM